jgi:hypothetical protein
MGNAVLRITASSVVDSCCWTSVVTLATINCQRVIFARQQVTSTPPAANVLFLNFALLVFFLGFLFYLSFYYSSLFSL